MTETPFVTNFANATDRQHPACEALIQENYAQATQLCQQCIESDPGVPAHYWYLGLALLLQGEEADAQAAWMLPLMEGNTEQVSEWTAELVAVLQAEAERREARADWAIAWVLRQHSREIAPDDLTNLLRSIPIGIEAGLLTAEYLGQSGVLECLHSAETFDETLARSVLDRLLQAMPLESGVLEFADACLQRSGVPDEIVLRLMHRAIDLSDSLGQPTPAVRYAELCLKYRPNDLYIWSQLVYFYRNAYQPEVAIEAAQKVCLLAQALPDQVYGAFLMLQSLLRAGNYWHQIFPIFEHQESLIAALTQSPTILLDQTAVLHLITSTFCAPYIRDSLAQNRLTQNRLLALCQASVEGYAKEQTECYRQGLAERRHHRTVPNHRTAPIRIGYLSYCLRRHSVGWLARWLFQHHDRDRFQLYGYFWNTLGHPMDDLQEWFTHQVTQSRLLGRDSQEIAAQIFADDIDILIDLDSVTADISCEVLMLKPAPVQVTWLGWDAPGIPAVDYFLADPYVLPDHAEAHYAEKIWRLPQTYIAVDGFEVGVPTLRREDLGIPADAVIYLSGQSAYKRHPDTVRSQMQIVQAIPNSYLLIKGIFDNVLLRQDFQQYFIDIAVQTGVDPSRLRFLPEVPQESVHRANLAIADIILDTYPYNGATTTMETLWMGIPLVTRVGDHFSSRNSYTMMVNAGISEGIAWTEAEYIQWGIRFGQEPALRLQVAWKLRQSRQTAPLWNAKQFTREMEHAYEEMCKMNQSAQ